MAGNNGGARPGAGRKPGVTNGPQLRDQLSQEQIDALVAKGIEEADAGDSLMLKFLLGQIFGKAPQPLTGDGRGPIQIQGVEITVAKNSYGPIKVGFEVGEEHLALWERDFNYAFLMGGRGNGRSGTASRYVGIHARLLQHASKQSALHVQQLLVSKDRSKTLRTGQTRSITTSQSARRARS